MILADAGNFFALDHPESDILSVVAWREMERLGYDAVTLGRRELVNWRLTRQLTADGTLPLVTTNLQWQRESGWELVGSPYLMLDREGVRFGILGVTSESQLPRWVAASAQDSIRLLPSVETTRAQARTLRRQADVVVALVAGKPEELRSLALQVPELDVIIGGSGTCRGTCPYRLDPDGAVFNTAGFGGGTVGMTKLIISPSNRVVGFGGSNVRLTAAMREDPVIAEDARRVVGLSRGLGEERRQHRGSRRRATPR